MKGDAKMSAVDTVERLARENERQKILIEEMRKTIANLEKELATLKTKEECKA